MKYNGEMEGTEKLSALMSSLSNSRGPDQDTLSHERWTGSRYESADNATSFPRVRHQSKAKLAMGSLINKRTVTLTVNALSPCCCFSCCLVSRLRPSNGNHPWEIIPGKRIDLFEKTKKQWWPGSCPFAQWEGLLQLFFFCLNIKENKHGVNHWGRTNL